MKRPGETMSTPDRLPDLFVVGGPKCGTTSLFSWLDQHPGFYLPNKEPNFLSVDVFDARSEPGAYCDWAAYIRAMCPKSPRPNVYGDFTPRYLYSDIALQVLSSHPDRPVVIALLRNPVDLVFSLHGQMLRQGIERERDFDKAWERALERGDDPENWRDRRGRIDRRLDYPLYGRIGCRIRKYVDAIDPSRFRIFILEEDLTHHPGAVYREVLSLLDLPWIDVSFDRLNERRELRSLWLNRAMIGARDAVRYARLRLGGQVQLNRKNKGTGLMKLVNRLNVTAPAEASAPTPEQRIALAEYYGSDVAELFAVLGRPIEAWWDFRDLSAKAS